MSRYLIIGCGPTGTNAAEEIRKADPKATITMLSHERLRVVARPRLVEYASGQIAAEELETKDAEWFRERQIELLLETPAKSLDPLGHEVKLVNGQRICYDHCLLSVGITPRPVPIPGANLKGVCHMHYLEQADRVRAAVEQAELTVVVGGGLLGQDMTQALCNAGRRVTLLVREDFVGFPQFDTVSGGMVEDELRRMGAEIRKSTEVKIIVGQNGRMTGVTLSSGSELSCQAIFFAIGAMPNAGWLESSGLRVNRGIVVDSQLRTNLPDVYSAGSGTEYHVRGKELMQASWGNATAAGKTAGKNMAGGQEAYDVPSDYTTRVGEKKFTLFGSPRQAFPKARFVGFHGDEGGYAALLEEQGMVRGGILVGKHQKAKEIKHLQMLSEPVPLLDKLPDQNQTSVSEFVSRALSL